VKEKLRETDRVVVLLPLVDPEIVLLTETELVIVLEQEGDLELPSDGETLKEGVLDLLRLLDLDVLGDNDDEPDELADELSLRLVVAELEGEGEEDLLSE